MAGTLADRLWRESAPAAIEADLAALWRQLGGGETRVARAVMSNLIVFRSRGAAPPDDIAELAADLPVDEVAARHPSRVIVIEHCDHPDLTVPSAAAVAVLTFGPEQARYGVEQIVVRSACPDAALLSILRRFVRGDVPTSVWWTEDLSAAPPRDPLLTVGRQLLYDSGIWRDVGAGIRAVAALAADGRVDIADLNWRRLEPLRDAVRHARGPQPPADWPTAPIRVAHAPHAESIAWLMAGWLATECRGGDARPIEVAAGTSGTDTLTITIGGRWFTLTDRAVVFRDDVSPPGSVGVRVESAADAVAAELRALARDAPLIAAIEAVARRFAANA